MWHTIKSGKIWKGVVKNQRKDKSYYWVNAEVSGVYKDGELVGYKSIRSTVDEDTKIQMQNKYDKLRREEEGNSRAVVYLKNENIEKIKKLAKEKGAGTDDILNDIVSSAS